MKVLSTKDYAAHGVKVLTYGVSGVGKTTLCATAPSPVILSAESGLLALTHVDIPVIEISSFNDLTQAFQWIKSSAEAKDFQTICIDSISDIAEVLLRQYKAGVKDARVAYGRMNDDTANAIRNFRDLSGKNVYFTAKAKRLEDETSGLVSHIPSMPGKTMLEALPYFFDEVFALRFGNKDKEGNEVRYLQAQGDLQWIAKDRSGKLGKQESPNLSTIFTKIAEEN